MTSPLPESGEDVMGLVERLRKRADSYRALGRPETTVYADYGPSDEKLDRDILAALSALAGENGRLRAERDDARWYCVDESRIVDRIWKALGITGYEQAKPYAIHEHVERLRARLTTVSEREREVSEALDELVRLRDVRSLMDDPDNPYTEAELAREESDAYEVARTLTQPTGETKEKSDG